MIIVGTLESSDCMITMKKADQNTIEVDSIVFEAFGQQIKAVIESALLEANINNVTVICQDKGALDYTIKARMQTAIERYIKEGFS